MATASGAEYADKTAAPIKIGISSCLLGEAVRYDGGHKRQPFLTETLGPFVEWVPICPEVECGLGTPREPMHLVDAGRGPRLVTVNTSVDLTGRMDEYARRRIAELSAIDLCGYVFKKDSPSCGLTRVKVHDRRGVATESGRGLFAARLVKRFPDLPVEDEGRLSDPGLRENFIERVFAYRRLLDLFKAKWKPGALVAFHTAHKLILMAHSPAAYRTLGRLVAESQDLPRQELRRNYTSGFMSALATTATPGTHTNVLQHMAGYLKDRIDPAGKAELHSTIDDYRRGLVPLAVPLTLMRDHVRRHDVPYLAGQLYLEPRPWELLLRRSPHDS